MEELRDTVELFKKDLWKDQRKLEVIRNDSNKKMLIKHYDNLEEMDSEISIINHLNNKNVDGIPQIISYGNLSTVMPYYNGIRLFNLFVELDLLTQNHNDKISRIKRELLSKCENRQRTIQEEILIWGNQQIKRKAYPHAKLKSIVYILASCLEIEIEKSAIEKEIDDINCYWEGIVNVPFRDATSKNMILNSSKLSLENYSSDSERANYIRDSIIDGSYIEWLHAPIVDIDFSSTLHNTTLEDDVISLKYHERTWDGVLPHANDLLWIGKSDGKRAAITFLIRYFRFGGRKAAYRLIHPTAHRIRFKYDSDVFYFRKLPMIMKSLWPECMEIYPNLMNFIEVVSRYLVATQVTTDLFLEYGNKQANYYTDVYPN